MPKGKNNSPVPVSPRILITIQTLKISQTTKQLTLSSSTTWTLLLLLLFFSQPFCNQFPATFQSVSPFLTSFICFFFPTPFPFSTFNSRRKKKNGLTLKLSRLLGPRSSGTPDGRVGENGTERKKEKNGWKKRTLNESREFSLPFLLSFFPSSIFLSFFPFPFRGLQL